MSITSTPSRNRNVEYFRSPIAGLKDSIDSLAEEGRAGGAIRYSKPTSHHVPQGTTAQTQRELNCVKRVNASVLLVAAQDNETHIVVLRTTGDMRADVGN